MSQDSPCAPPLAPRSWGWADMCVVGATALGVLIALSGRSALPITEALGFATGAICVWLVVRESIWNFPVGLANNVAFFVLFLGGRLYADMLLQVVYFVLGVYGWRRWIHGGPHGTALRVSRAQPLEWAGLAIAVSTVTWGLGLLVAAWGGAAPFWDSLTTALSLAAQYLLCQKRWENWLFWIVADLIYVPLYLSRGLPLTAALYGVFLVLCLVGLRAWLAEYRAGSRPAGAAA